nr:MAG TPA: hypothetical protein [Caudoviricetes sp.]
MDSAEGSTLGLLTITILLYYCLIVSTYSTPLRVV